MYSKETPNLGLPIWEAGDHPEFAGDIGAAFLKIDRAYGEHGDMDSGIGELREVVRNLTNAVEKNTVAIQQLQTSVENIEIEIAPIPGMKTAIIDLQGRLSLLEQITAGIGNTIGTEVDGIANTVGGGNDG